MIGKKGREHRRFPACVPVVPEEGKPEGLGTVRVVAEYRSDSWMIPGREASTTREDCENDTAAEQEGPTTAGHVQA